MAAGGGAKAGADEGKEPMTPGVERGQLGAVEES